MFSSETGDSAAPANGAKQQRMQNKISKVEIISADFVQKNISLTHLSRFIGVREWMSIIGTISL
jgi:hypothetical protein